MPPKTLSNGTLSLKFMQRKAGSATIAVDGKVQLIQAKVADEAEWDVGKEVREAWGLSSNGAGPSNSSSVVSEASYLPFLRSEDDSGDEEDAERVQRPLGRWNNLPVEKPKAAAALEDEIESDATSVSNNSPSEEEPRKLKRKQPPKTSQSPTRADPADANRKRPRPTDRYDLSKVASSPKGSASPKPKPPISATHPVFLRPAGVDVPRTSSKVDTPKKKKKKKAAATPA